MTPPSDPGSTPNHASILAWLRNRAGALGLPPDQMLLLYCLEGVLTRLSTSAYQEQLVLKGGLEPLIASSFASSTAVLLNVRIH